MSLSYQCQLRGKYSIRPSVALIEGPLTDSDNNCQLSIEMARCFRVAPADSARFLTGHPSQLCFHPFERICKTSGLVIKSSAARLLTHR